MNWSTRWTIIAVVAMGLLGLGCTPHVDEVEVTQVIRPVDVLMPQPNSLSGDAHASLSSLDAGSVSAAEETEATLQLAERLIILNGELTIVAEDTQATMEAIRNMVDDVDGWVTESDVVSYGDGNRPGNMSIRVPSASFNTAMEEIKSVAENVLRESITGQDVTEEYVDLSARLANLQATATRVRSFLDEAETVEAALEVNRELSRLEGELDSVQGRLQFLTESATYSSITINIRPNVVPPVNETLLWQPIEVVKEARDALLWTIQGLGTIVIWIGVYFLPAALIFALPVWFAWRWLRKRSRAWAGSV